MPTGAGRRPTSIRRCGPTRPGWRWPNPAVIARGIGRLEADLASGAWQDRHADLLGRDAVDLGYRLLVADVS